MQIQRGLSSRACREIPTTAGARNGGFLDCARNDSLFVGTGLPDGPQIRAINKQTAEDVGPYIAQRDEHLPPYHTAYKNGAHPMDPLRFCISNYFLNTQRFWIC